MSDFAKVIWYKCEKCKKPCIFLHQVGIKWVCEECKKEEEQKDAKK